MDAEIKPVVVFGGTGHFGRNIVQKLVEKNQPVRVVTRDRARAEAVLGNKVALIEGDVTDRETIRISLENAGAVVLCLSALTRKLIRKMTLIERNAVLAILEEAAGRGISRVIYMSGYEMRMPLLRDLKIPEFGAIKIEIEAALTRSDFNWTILGDAPSFDLFFAFLRNGKMIVPGGGQKPIPAIAAEDVGEIAAQAVLRTDLKGRRLRLTGPEAFTFPAAAARLTRLTGREIKHMAVPLAIVAAGSWILLPLTPFPRYLYKSLKLLNHFPSDLADRVPQDHAVLRSLFDYEPVTLDREIRRRMETGDPRIVKK